MAEANLGASSSAADTPQPLASGAIAATTASILFVIAGYVINVVLGRSLGPVDYGLFGVVIGLMTIVNALQVSGVPQALAKFTAEQRHSAADLLVTGGLIQLGLAIILGLALLIFAGPIAALLNDARLTDPLRLAAFAFPSYAVFTLLSGVEGGRGRYVRQASMLSVYSVAKAVLAVGGGLLFSFLGAIAGYVLAPLVGSLASSDALAFRRGRLVPMRPIVSYSLPLILLALISMAYLTVDLLLVKTLDSDPASAGYYTAAQNVARVPYYLAAGLATILLPAIARIRPGDARGGLIVSDALRFGLLLVLPVTILLVATAQDSVQLLYGYGYLAAATPLRLLTVAMGVFALFSILVSLLAGVGQTLRAVFAALAGLFPSTVAAITVIPSLGIDGAALATLLGAVVAFAVACLATYRVLPFEFPWITLLRAGGASVVIGLLGLLLNGTIATLVGVPLLMLLYAGLLIVTRELSRADWRRLRLLFPATATRP